MEKTNIKEATHVRVTGVLGGSVVHRIKSKWGIDDKGRPALISQGGFGVITESGKRISMWNARGYYKES